VLNGLLDNKNFNVWAPVPRMIEIVFNSGRNGWSASMIDNFRRLAWRYCILYEEMYATSSCVINLHNLTHLSDDVQRFSSPDNYWCFDFERAVKRYVRQSTNKKYVEKSFAKRETQREFLRFFQDTNRVNCIRPEKNINVDKEKVGAIFFSLLVLLRVPLSQVLLCFL